MLKGLALTPPVIGRISIGRVVEKNGKRLPEKDDEFTITSQVQLKDGWVLHPVDEVLRKDTNAKLRSIPVRLLFGDPDLSLRVKYTLFERTTGRPLCVGDGESCRRVTPSGMQSLPCPAPHACALAVGGACKPYGRLHVRIDASGKAGSESGHEVGCDELGSFVFRTTGFNSIRTLLARLHYLHAVSGASLSRSCPRSLFEDTSGGQLLASHSASHVSPRLFLLGAALGRGNTARVDRPCQAQQMLRNLPA